MSNARTRLAVLISGRGSNMLKLLDAVEQGQIEAEVALVLSDNPLAEGLSLAAARGVQTATCSPADFEDKPSWETALQQQLEAAQTDLIALAGFMRVLSPTFCAAWTGQLLNIHPSLLPRHKGLDTHRRALAAGDTHAGCSVHFVTAELDGGPVIAQSRVTVEADDTEESLAARVLKREHVIYPQVISWCASKQIELQHGVVYDQGTKLAAPRLV